MEGGIAAMDSRPSPYNIDNDHDGISYDSDSSGDSKLRKIMERKLLKESSQHGGASSSQQLPLDLREGVPAESPSRRRNSKERTRPRASSLTSNSPISYSWYYNAYTQRDYSPSVSSVTPQKTITSWMDAMMRTPLEQDLQADEDDDVSIDSVEQLEQVAAQIRSEIRQLEMKELADEAEIAAAAGQERFAGRASTFGDSSSSLGDVDYTELKPSTLKRYSTYSEGTSLLKQVRPARTRPKIRCLQLRDVNEVIPSIGELHSNLRTHLMLAGVQRQSLEANDIIDETETRAAYHRARAVKSPVQFLSSLKSWVSTSPSGPRSASSTDVASNATTPRKTTARSDSSNKPKYADTGGDSCECSVGSHDSYEVGGMLSAHIHEPKAVQRSPIRIPSGLDLPDDLGIPHELPPKLILSNDADVDTVETAPTSSSSQQDDSNQDQNNRESSARELDDLTPITLFEQVEIDDDDSPEEGIECHDLIAASSHSMLVTSPTGKTGELWSDASASNMFVTPNRLRGIRKASRELISRRSLRHQSADLGWTLKVVKLRHSKSDPEGLYDDDEPLDMTELRVMSEDRDMVLKDGNTIAEPLNCSRDESVAPIPDKDTSKSYHSLADSPHDVSIDRDTSEIAIEKLHRPLSLSFDEHNMTDVVDPDSASDSAKECAVSNDCEKNEATDCGARQCDVQTTRSHDLSLSVGPSDEVEVAKAVGPLIAIEAVDADGNVEDADNRSHERESEVATSQVLSVDESLPLMPLLEKIDEPTRAAEDSCIDCDIGSDGEGMRSLSHIVLPRMDMRTSFTESAHDISQIEIDNESLPSLQFEDLVETGNSCSLTEKTGVADVDNSASFYASDNARAETETQQDKIAAECSDEKADLTDLQSASSGSISEMRSMEKSDIETTVYATLPLAKAAADTSSEIHASELPFDEKEQVPENDSPVYDIEKGRQSPDNSRVGGNSATSPEPFGIEVRELADVPSDSSRCGIQSKNGSPGYRKREEIVRSPSGRVRVTMIEQSLHDDGSDDDVVQSENDSIMTPQSDPCECLINVARQFEENVSSDLVKTSQCAQARYHLCMPSLDQNAENAPKVSTTTNAFPTNIPQNDGGKQPLLPETAFDVKKSPPRRALSCPDFVALSEVDTSIDSFLTMPHKRNFEERVVTSPFSSSDRGFYERNRRQLVHASSVLDPCQSASPFRETMDDMMKNFSSKRSMEVERRERELAIENRDFLHNYLYCSKPPDQPDGEHTHPNMCGDHCDFMSGVLDTYRSIVPIRSSSGKDMLSLNAGIDETFPPAVSETWFDVASEHFDGALERVLGSAHAQSRRWNSMFQAPSLKSKKESRQTKATRTNKDVKGILLVKQSSTMDSQDGEISDQQFESMYGMKRQEFAQLPVTERSHLHDRAHENLRRLMSRPSASQGSSVSGAPSRVPPSPATSCRSLSSSDLPKMDLLI